jgi:hypothetical protein
MGGNRQRITIRTLPTTRKAVDDKLLKFHAGAVPWSPAIQKNRDCVEYWHRVLITKTDVLTSRTAIKRLSIKIGE